MSNKIIFIMLFFAPLFVLGFLMTSAQSRFLKSFREIVNPDKPISTEEAMKLFVQKVKKPDEFIKFMRDDLNNYPGRVTKLYWQHYNNPKLEKEANEVKKYTRLIILVPLIGFIIAVIVALTN